MPIKKEDRSLPDFVYDYGAPKTVEEVIEEEKKPKSYGPLVRGKGKLLPERLRQLPEELVAKDDQDPDRPHELDPKHIVQNLAEEFEENQILRGGLNEEQWAKKKNEEAAAESRKKKPVKQEFVDLIVMRAIKNEIDHAHYLWRHGKKHEFKVLHLWFPEDDIRVYELRDGNPPADSRRPRHLKGLKLEVDAKAGIPPRILAQIRASPTMSAAFDSSVQASLDEIMCELMDRQYGGLH